MIQASKIIGTGLATTGLIGAGVGAGFLTVALLPSQPESESPLGPLIIVITTET